MALPNPTSLSTARVVREERSDMIADRQPIDLTLVRRERSLRGTVDKILALPRWEQEWGGGDVVSSTTIEYALAWIMQMFEYAEQSNFPWHDPNIFGTPDGEAVFEWWHQERNLTIYIKEHIVIYLKAWGSDINTEMENGEATTSEMRVTLWTWLYN